MYLNSNATVGFRGIKNSYSHVSHMHTKKKNLKPNFQIEVNWRPSWIYVQCYYKGTNGQI